jgi:hypothetical protein
MQGLDEEIRMHTIMVVTGGLVLMAFCLVVGRWLGGSSGLATAALLFVPIWLIATAVNLWVGVAKAGYSVAEELPIFALLFAPLAAIAAFVWWKYKPGP